MGASRGRAQQLAKETSTRIGCEDFHRGHNELMAWDGVGYEQLRGLDNLLDKGHGHPSPVKGGMLCIREEVLLGTEI